MLDTHIHTYSFSDSLSFYVITALPTFSVPPLVPAGYLCNDFLKLYLVVSMKDVYE